jgi:hypothetical protein
MRSPASACSSHEIRRATGAGFRPGRPCNASIAGSPGLRAAWTVADDASAVRPQITAAPFWPARRRGRLRPLSQPHPEGTCCATQRPRAPRPPGRPCRPCRRPPRARPAPRRPPGCCRGPGGRPGRRSGRPGRCRAGRAAGWAGAGGGRTGRGGATAGGGRGGSGCCGCVATGWSPPACGTPGPRSTRASAPGSHLLPAAMACTGRTVVLGGAA